VTSLTSSSDMGHWELFSGPKTGLPRQVEDF
jgi:hypothetical protein